MKKLTKEELKKINEIYKEKMMEYNDDCEFNKDDAIYVGENLFDLWRYAIGNNNGEYVEDLLLWLKQYHSETFNNIVDYFMIFKGEYLKKCEGKYYIVY